jgi:hypothetical protein
MLIPHGLAILDRNLFLVSENNRFQTMIPGSNAILGSIHPDDIGRANASLNEFTKLINL